ncbi:hypothetical protein [Streptomyces sp. NPDC029674]|uniref:hypothetical protein n=1 Tax=Streptomyces sp. NPDC029674 TaxID=3365297 RepID=UPI00384B0E6A
MRPEVKLTVFTILATLFGVLCILIGVTHGDYWLLGAGVAAVGFGLFLGGLMIKRQARTRAHVTAKRGTSLDQ